MRPLKDIKKAIGHAKLESKTEVNETVLRHLRAELATATSGTSTPARRCGWRMAVKTLAAAAIVIVALLVVRHPPRSAPAPAPESRTESAADLLTVGCLNAAYRRGGLEALDRQCEEAACRLETPPEKVSVQALVRELKGT